MRIPLCLLLPAMIWFCASCQNHATNPPQAPTAARQRVAEAHAATRPATTADAMAEDEALRPLVLRPTTEWNVVFALQQAYIGSEGPTRRGIKFHMLASMLDDMMTRKIT